MKSRSCSPPPNFEGLALDQQAHPNTQEGLARVFDAHTGTVGVGEAQGTGAQAIHVVVEDVIPLAGQFVDAVGVGGADGMLLVNGEMVRLAIELTRAGKDDLHGRVVFATGFEDGDLGLGVDGQIGVGVLHGVHVAGLARQIEQDILSLDQMLEAVFVAHIGDVDAHAVGNGGDIEEVATVFRDEAVDEGHLCAQLDQTVGEVGADEAQPASDEDT